MEQKANITIDKEHITVEDKLKALAELDFRQGKLCA